MSNILDLTNVINVTVLGTPSNLGIPNVNTAALFSRETPSPVFSAGYKVYTNSSQVATDFGSGSSAAKIAASFFAQQPNPLSTGGYLVIIPLTSMETVKAAIIRTIDLVYYFGVLVDESYFGQDSVLETLATYMQSIDKMLFIGSSHAADYTVTTGVFDIIRAAGETHTRCLYYHDGTEIDTQRMAAAYAGRALSTDFSGSNTTQTMHLKVLSTIVPDTTIDQTGLDAAVAAGADTYVNIGGVSCVFCSGKNAFFDEVYNELWFKFALQTAGFNYIRGTSTKIPQTESGLDGLKNIYRQVCAQAATNGFIGAGKWTSDEVFGDPASLIRNVASIGYYVYSLPLSQQSQADREARIAPLIQIAVKAQGAVQKSNVLVFVNL